ncbi:MAG: nucleoside hydrolase [Maioricimonas sp. JB045]
MNGHPCSSLLRAACIAATLGLLLTGPMAARADEPVRIIFDTDITGDVDDVLALAMLHTLADRGECELLAVTISKINPLTGPFVDAVNTFYGRPDIPIGVPQEAQRRESKYLKVVNARDNGQFRYPHDLLSNADAYDAVDLLRKTLAAQPDHSVVLVQVGIAPNLARLLETKGDEWSDLDGPALIRKKVKLLSIMAGAFEPIRGNDHYLEANVINGIPAMQKLAADWPDDVPAIWSGFEIGIAARYPRASIHHDFDYVPHHIVKDSYLLHSGPNHDRPTWDLTSVLYAVYPERGYFDLSDPGRVSVEDDGFVRFTPAENGRDRYLVMSDEQAVRVREALVMMVSQPPRRDDAK